MANAKEPSNSIFVGTFIHCKSLTALEELSDTAVLVGREGKILAIERNVDGKDLKGVFEKAKRKFGWEEEEYIVRQTKGGEFYFPGFIDTHIHASQYANAGIFGKSTLLDWLETYTFPMESSLSDLSKAQTVYSRCVARTLQNGTTTASYFATIDVPATNLLADICLAAGQRAFIGRVCMDTLSPEYYRDESVDTCIAATKACINHIRSKDPNYHLISPIITPRFAPSCTTEMLHALGSLQQATNLPVQTHISENKAEIALVQGLFPGSKHYTDVYDKANLLTSKTILAHAIHLSQEELQLLSERKSKISHCPASNSAITSGTARVRWMLDHGVDVGLGTDMSGGYSASILEAVRQALLVSRHVAMNVNSESMGRDDREKERAKLTVEECLWLATRGGARVLGLGDRVGGFEVGMEWDAQLIGLGMVGVEGVDEGPVDIFGWELGFERVEKWVFGGDDRNTRAVWVGGRLVHERR